MGISKLISNYSHFNEWANEKIIEWLRGVDKESLFAATPSSFNSINDTLQHILRAQRFWISFISQEDITHFKWSMIENDWEKVLNELNEVSTHMKIKFNSFNEDELEAKLFLDTPWLKNNLSRYEYIMHVINHNTYHRGQIITMAHCLGIEKGIVNTDYNIFNTELQKNL